MSDNPVDFGVIIHSTDQTEDPERPWAVCSASNLACGFFSDRISASVVYKGKTSAYSGGGGLVVRPQYARLLCGYGGDGGTRVVLAARLLSSQPDEGSAKSWEESLADWIRQRPSGETLERAAKKLAQTCWFCRSLRPRARVLFGAL